MNKQWKFFALSALFALGFTACNKDDDAGEDPIPETGFQNTVLVFNEGSFQAGNGSLTHYDYESGESSQAVYSSANGMPLGDIVYSGTYTNDALYIVVNNSGKVEKLNPETFESIAKVEGLTSPRFFLPVSESKAYVSDLFGGMVSIINPTDMSLTGSIAIPGWTEQMLLVDNTLWITNPGGNQLYGIDINTDAITDSITIEKDATSLVQDANGNVWVLCIPDWKTPRDHEAALFKLDLNTNTASMRMDFSASNSPSSLCINQEGNNLYWLDNGVYEMSTSASTLPNVSFIAAYGIPYGLAINPSNNQIYVTDGGDFSSNSEVHRFSENGNLLHTFDAGIAPGNIIFK